MTLLTRGFGPQGTQGSQGSASTAVGPTGPQGATGNDGAPGPQGTQGSQGSQGSASTSVGPTGATGPQGTQGSQGPQGTQGTQGSLGPTGATGSQGPQGTQGSIGVDGARGTQGSQGSIGLQGTQGSQGSIGTNFVMAPIVVTASGVTFVKPEINTTQILSLINIATGMTIFGPSGTPNDGQKLVVRIRSATATGYSITWNQVAATNFTARWAPPTLPTRSGATGVWCEFMYDAGQLLNKWVLTRRVNG